MIPRRVPLIFGTASLVVFGWALANPYYFDDVMVLRDNVWLRQLNDPLIWFRSFFIDSNHLFSGYRPTLMLSFWANLALLGDSPLSLRIGNLILHTTNAILLFALIHRLSNSEANFPVAWMAGLLFLTHPLQTLGINFLWKRSSLLEATLLLTAMLLHVNERNRSRYRGKIVAIQILLFVSAITTKESGLILPLLFLSLDFFFFGIPSAFRQRATRLLYFSIFVIGGLFTWVRLFHMPSWLAAHHATLPDRRLVSASAYVLQQISVVPQYLGQWLLPRPLLFDDPLLVTGFPWRGALLCVLLATGSIFPIVRYRREPLLSFAVALFWLVLSPTLGPTPLYFVMDPIRLYLPIAGLSILVAVTLSSLRPKLGWILFILLALLSSVRSVIQNQRYSHPDLIWRDVADTYPRSGLAWEGLGAVLQADGRFQDSAEAYREAARVEPGNHIYAVDALYSAFQAGMPKDELASQIHVISTSKLDVRRLVNLAIVEAQVGETKLAEEHFRLAIETFPQFGLSYLNYGILLEKSGRKEEARRAFHQALARLPDHPAARAGLQRLE
ncbi:MAG TPA: tetratricopeptide repeat protein [Bdellovibrionota bacterium]|nr:tetratricopeptide repeat protein [Bdellovibrionota bacterium]